MWYVYRFILYSCFSECDLSEPTFISPGQCETENISCSCFGNMAVVCGAVEMYDNTQGGVSDFFLSRKQI